MLLCLVKLSVSSQSVENDNLDSELNIYGKKSTKVTLIIKKLGKLQNFKSEFLKNGKTNPLFRIHCQKENAFVRKGNLASHWNCFIIICKELCQGTTNSPIKLQITPTDVYKACLEAIVCVCFANSAIEGVIYGPKATNDGASQTLHHVVSSKTITSVIYNRILEYLLPTCVTDKQKNACWGAHNVNLLKWEVCLFSFMRTALNKEFLRNTSKY